MAEPNYNKDHYENNYIKVETLLNEYLKTTNPIEKTDLLEQLLISIKPLIIASCKHYFGMTTEDLIQDGFEKAINIIHNYKSELTEVRFLGYAKRMMMCYYWDRKRTELKKPYQEVSRELVEESTYEEIGYQRVELTDILNILSEREKDIVIRVYLKGHRQKTVANDLGLSLAYVKETLSKARKKMREVVCF